MSKLSVDKALLKAKSHTKRGEIVEAQNLYRTVLQAFPTNKRAQKALATLTKLKQSTATQGMPQEIISRLIDLYNQSKLEEVIELATLLTKQYPETFELWNILGAAAAQTGKFEKATNSFEKAVNLKPDYADAHNNIGNVLKEQGRLKEAIKSFSKALLLRPNFAEAYKNIGNALKEVAFNQPNPLLQKIIVSLLDQRSSVRPNDIASVAINLLKFDLNLQRQLETPNKYRNTQTLHQKVTELSNLPLLLKLMSVCPIPDLSLEKLLKEVRAEILLALPNLEDTSDMIQFQTALALQCFTNEYIYSQSEDEEQAIEVLENSIEISLSKGQQPSPRAILCLASYKALHKYKWHELLVSSSDIDQVFARQVSGPIQEAQLKSDISSLDATTNNISIKVRSQYESHPYPRWVKLGLPLKPEPISKVAAKAKIELFDTKICEVSNPSILVAGCGTGQHPISTAARFKNSKVLAIDLSLSSLAYAKRQTEELGITSIKYMQGDILKLKKLDKQFDIIESVGVLHHMDNPMDGWTALVDCLKEGGLMRIGLYSELARQQIVEIRKEIAQLGTGSGDADMKSFREMLIHSEKKDYKKIRSWPDFYSLSELRDLLFHVQEHRFTIPQIRHCLEELGLKFCGFTNKALLQKFRKSNTGPKALYDLDLWHIYEETNPNTFTSMYQFWCQKVL